MSTMETQTVSSRNVVDFLLKEEFNAAICPPGGILDGDSGSTQTPLSIPEPPLSNSENFVLGFDC